MLVRFKIANIFVYDWDIVANVRQKGKNYPPQVLKIIKNNKGKKVRWSHDYLTLHSSHYAYN